MDARLRELVDYTKETLGLENYYLHSHDLDRSVSNQNKTMYTLEMEWLPEHITAYDEEDEVPSGTAAISLYIDSRKFNSIIFVGGKSYLNKPILQVTDKAGIIRWIETETGLTYEQDFVFWKEEDARLSFKRIINGLEISPIEWIDIEFDEEGNLVFFNMYGDFMNKLPVKEEIYTLDLHKAEQITKQQFQHWDFPFDEQKRIVTAYAIEEVYIRNDLSGTFSFEQTHNTKEIDYVMEWDAPISKRFKRKPVEHTRDITPKQAFACEPHPETFPLTDEDIQMCVKEVRSFLQKVYSNDTGKWRMTSIHRHYDFIDVKLVQTSKSKNIYKRKLLVMLDGSSFKAFNYMDNEPMLEIFSAYKMPGESKMSKEAAYEAVKRHFILKPRYVYDKETKEYTLCGYLDCHHYVDAETGKVGLLNDL
ncbi:hypothetical protein CEQ21_14785 [Niallia circulans]|uniref:Uncharacterized protein n=1 Tax=Niallia circulans TaxID=1397 RepID=A0A553SIF9_NIACI|nr:hypothetical protein [Niallia circulans]TRZ36777.1 hypothetical protein CEQ21_14785 [Niallia circulans]